MKKPSPRVVRAPKPAGGPAGETVPLDPMRTRALAVHIVDEPGREPITLDRVLRVGRDDTADLALDDDAASREHAEIEPGDPPTVRDLESRNGTFVNGERLAPGARAKAPAGTTVRVGRTLLLIDHARAKPPPAPPGRARRSVEGPMAEVFDLADRLADDDITVLLTGETGVGKEVLAQYLHASSRRREGPFVPVHAAALAPSLFESELFGYEKGAFTGASEDRAGLFELAHGGTLFFDEIGELGLGMQPKLLRVLEDKRVTRVGGRVARDVDVRIVAATNRDLAIEVERGAFRADLYFRLGAFPLAIPPLRERTVEIPALAERVLAIASEARDRRAPALGDDAIRALVAHDWPGNVRELRSVLTRALFFAPLDATSIDARAIEKALAQAPATSPRTSSSAATAATMKPEGDDERARILDALARHAGNQSLAAADLGIARRTMLNKLDRLGVARPRKKH